MRKVLVIAAREYLVVVRGRPFVLSLVLVPLVMVGAVLFLGLATRPPQPPAGPAPLAPVRFAVVDRTGRLMKHLQFSPDQPFRLVAVDPGASDPEAVQAQRARLAEQVRRGEWAGYLDVSAEAISRPAGQAEAVLAAGSSPQAEIFRAWVRPALVAAVWRERALAAGMEPAAVERQFRPLTLVDEELATPTVPAPTLPPGVVTVFATMGLMGLIMLLVTFGCNTLIQGVFEEKIARIAEVLLGSVDPFGLMLGKLLGAVAVALTNSAVYLACGLGLAIGLGYGDALPLEVVGCFAASLVLMLLMYGAVFLALGAACSDPREAQALMLPVMGVLVLPMALLPNVVGDPQGPAAVAVTFYPPAAPLYLLLRVAVPPGVPWWQLGVSVLLVAALTLATVWAAGRIFRVGLLVQGRGATWGEMARWVVRG